jgi:hypothetical protein
MKMLSIIFDHCEINKILKHLVKIGKFPSGLDESVFNWSIIFKIFFQRPARERKKYVLIRKKCTQY